jgi:hypothetical protein
MSARRRSYRVRIGILLAATLVACGGPDICLQCPSGTPTPTSSVTVTGSGLATTPPVNPASVTVIICLNLADNEGADACTQSFFTDVTTQGSFTRSSVSPGPETIFFWVDANNDGMVDPDDPIAKLTDTQGQLGDVQTGQTVTLTNISANFTTELATATISVGQSATPTPTAVTATPTPSP